MERPALVLATVRVEPVYPSPVGVVLNAYSSQASSFPMGPFASLPFPQRCRMSESRRTKIASANYYMSGYVGRFIWRCLKAVYRILCRWSSRSRRHSGFRLRPHLWHELFPSQLECHWWPFHGFQRFYDIPKICICRPSHSFGERSPKIVSPFSCCRTHPHRSIFRIASSWQVVCYWSSYSLDLSSRVNGVSSACSSLS